MRMEYGDYLMGAQLPDGSWGSGDPFICARALFALEGRMPDDALARGLDHLVGMQDPDGHFRRMTRTYSDESNTAYAMVVLNRFDYGKASLPISRGILWLLESQRDDGSWGPNPRKRAYTTTLCLRALHTFHLSGLRRFAGGLGFSMEYLHGLRFEDEPVSHVYGPILNLQRIGCLDGELRDRFIAYARGACGDAVARGDVADAACLLGTLKAVDGAGEARAVEDWLRAVRNPDGGHGKAAGAASDAGTTALVALAGSNRL